MAGAEDKLGSFCVLVVVIVVVTLGRYGVSVGSKTTSP